MTIENNDNGVTGIMHAMDDGKVAGKMTYSWAGDDRIIIDHTEVETAYRGKDVGKAMVRAVAEHARSKGVKVVPVCRFAKAIFQKEQELSDVL